MDLPLWAPHSIHRNSKEADCKQVHQRQLKDVGIETLRSIMDTDGNFLDFDALLIIVDRSSGNARAYNKLCSNIDLRQSHVQHGSAKESIWVHIPPLKDDDLCWKFCIHMKDRRASYRVGSTLGQVEKTYTHWQGRLYGTVLSDPPPDTLLMRFIVGLPQKAANGTVQLSYVVLLRDEIALTEHYMWKDGTLIFFTSSQHLQMLQLSASAETHVSVAKWQRYGNWQFSL